MENEEEADFRALDARAAHWRKVKSWLSRIPLWTLGAWTMCVVGIIVFSACLYNSVKFLLEAFNIGTVDKVVWLVMIIHIAIATGFLVLGVLSTGTTRRQVCRGKSKCLQFNVVGRCCHVIAMSIAYILHILWLLLPTVLLILVAIITGVHIACELIPECISLSDYGIPVEYADKFKPNELVAAIKNFNTSSLEKYIVQAETVVSKAIDAAEDSPMLEQILNQIESNIPSDEKIDSTVADLMDKVRINVEQDKASTATVEVNTEQIVEAIENMQGQVEGLGEDIDSGLDKASDMIDKYNNTVSRVVDKGLAEVDKVQDDVIDAIKDIGEGAANVMQDVNKGLEYIRENVSDDEEEEEGRVRSRRQTVDDRIDETRDKGEDIIDEAAEKVKQGIDDGKDAAKEALVEGSEKAKQLVEEAEDKLDELEDHAEKTLNDLKDEGEEVVEDLEDLVEKGEETLDDIKDKGEDLVEDLEQKGKQAIEDAKEEVEETIEEIVEEAQKMAKQAELAAKVAAKEAEIAFKRAEKAARAVALEMDVKAKKLAQDAEKTARKAAEAAQKAADTALERAKQAALNADEALAAAAKGATEWAKRAAKEVRVHAKGAIDEARKAAKEAMKGARKVAAYVETAKQKLVQGYEVFMMVADKIGIERTGNDTFCSETKKMVCNEVQKAHLNMILVLVASIVINLSMEERANKQAKRQQSEREAMQIQGPSEHTKLAYQLTDTGSYVNVIEAEKEAKIL